MSRISLVMVVCVVASFALVTSAQAATSQSGGAAARSGSQLAKTPKATKYRSLYYFEGVFLDEAIANVYNKTKTWQDEVFCDGGTFTKSGPSLVLTDECTGEVWDLTKVKKVKGVYFGPALSGGVPNGGEVEWIKE